MRVQLVVTSTVAAMAVATVVTGLAMAQAPDNADGYSKTDVLLEQIHTGAFLEGYISTQLGPLRAADRDNNGLDRGEVLLAAERQQAEARASQVERLLRNDLNGDLKVPRAEMVRAAKIEPEYLGRWVDQQYADMDANGDEVITLAEASDATTDRRNSDALELLLSLDPSGDHRLTADELRQLAERAFNSVDRDRDGKISSDERSSIDARVRNLSMIRSAPACDLPPAPARSQIVVFGTYDSDSMSSVAVGGPDQETNLIDVMIEPGITPLYLVLTSYQSMVWRVNGATARVSNVVVSSSSSVRTRPGMDRSVSGGNVTTGRRIARPEISSFRGKISASGVVGIAPRKVTIIRPGCLNYFDNSDAGSTRVIRATVRQALGREADAAIGNHSIRRIALPSGRFTNGVKGDAPVPSGFDPKIWEDAARYWPGGLVSVDPKRVVARAVVERYQVLPSQMGLSQLVGSGAIKWLSNDKYLIVRPIAHMPPSMGGAHSVTLRLAPGVPMPPGDPVHSCVITADGKSGGPNCR